MYVNFRCAMCTQLLYLTRLLVIGLYIMTSLRSILPLFSYIFSIQLWFSFPFLFLFIIVSVTNSNFFKK